MKYFTKLEQVNACWSLPINESDKDKTAFSSPSPIDLFEFNYLPFGLSNAPSIFRWLMNLLLSRLKWKSCMVYLDDVHVFAASFDQMISRLREVLKRLNEGGMKLRLKKCKYCETEVTYLGVKSFLRLVSYYPKFIQNCSRICQPLIKLLANDVEFVWLKGTTNCFWKFKRITY